MRIKHIAAAVAIILASAVLGAPPGNSAAPALDTRQQAGKALFFDQNLSVNKNQSCAACHGPQAGWTGPDSPTNAGGAVYEGSIPGAFGARKPPSAAYAEQSPILALDKKGTFAGGNFWDGRATGERLGNPAAEQALGPFLNPVEQAMPDSACVVYRACTSSYAGLIDRAWGTDTCGIAWPGGADATCGSGTGIRGQLTTIDQAKVDQAYDNIGLSIAAYEGSTQVSPFTSKYDLSHGGGAKLTQQERLGFALFKGKAQCSACHVINGKKPLLTDYTYDNLGVPKNPDNPVYGDNPQFVDLGLGGYLQQRPEYASFADENMGKMKVPTLRNVGAGYGTITKANTHNGYFKTLEGLVHFYNTRDVLATCPGDYTEAQALAANCWPAPEVSQNINRKELGNLGLSAEEEAALVAFMKTLSDGYRP